MGYANVMPTDRVARELELPSGATVSVTMPTFLGDEDRGALANALVTLGCEVHPDGGDWNEYPDHDILPMWADWYEDTDPIPGEKTGQSTIHSQWVDEGRRVVLILPWHNSPASEWRVILALLRLAAMMLWAKVQGKPVSQVGEEDP